MEKQKIIDALLNSGLVDVSDKMRMLTNIYDLQKSDIKKISDTIKDFDAYYLQGWKTSDTRDTLKNIVNSYCDAFRCYSLIID